MNMKEKWEKMLTGYYATLSEDCFIWKITPGLIKEYGPYLQKNSLFGMNIMDVKSISKRILKTLLEEYEETDKKLTFEQFEEQRLLAYNMVETLKFLRSLEEEVKE